jgi:hypothetical protein
MIVMRDPPQTPNNSNLTTVEYNIHIGLEM